MIVGRKISLQSVAASVRRANLIFLFWSLAVTAIDRRTTFELLSITSTPITILGAALTIFLAFRTNSAYDRWWEARTLWGGLVNQSRTLVRQILAFTTTNPITQSSGLDENASHRIVHDMAYRQMAFVNALRAHLRGHNAVDAVRPYLSAEDAEALVDAPNVPDALLVGMSLRLRKAYQDGLLDTIQLAAVDETLTELTNILGGCERIKNTPLPRQYDTVPQLTIFGYGLLLPLGMVDTLGWWTPVLSALIISVFIALDTIGSNIEDPFENSIHDTPMTALCRTIEINLRYTLGEKDLPGQIEPHRGVLH
jgi:putative membrane protein